jgi:hypothetical protein
VTPKKLDPVGLLIGARDGGGVKALLDGLEPSFPHYKRNRRMLAHYRSLAQAGEPDPVPSLPEARRKVDLETLDGVPADARPTTGFGDLTQDAPTAGTSDGTLSTMGRSSRR